MCASFMQVMVIYAGKQEPDSCFVLFSYPGANADIHVIPKIESADSIPNLQSIIAASDGVRPRWLCNPFDTKRYKFTERERTCNGIMNRYVWVVAMHDEHMKAVLGTLLDQHGSPFLFFFP